eukprot:7372435-Pyramimonas_sp.AAC.1
MRFYLRFCDFVYILCTCLPSVAQTPSLVPQASGRTRAQHPLACTGTDECPVRGRVSQHGCCVLVTSLRTIEPSHLTLGHLIPPFVPPRGAQSSRHPPPCWTTVLLLYYCAASPRASFNPPFGTAFFRPKRGRAKATICRQSRLRSPFAGPRLLICHAIL